MAIQPFSQLGCQKLVQEANLLSILSDDLDRIAIEWIMWIPFQDNKNYLRDLYGWGQAARKAETLRAELAVTEGNAPVIFTENWTLASRLSWYARPTPVVVLDTRYNQFDIWFGSPQNGAHGILVLWPDENAKPVTGGNGQFAECSLRDRLPIISNGHLASTFSFYSCHDYHN